MIAEIGVNHEGSIEKAYEMIEEAAANGADVAKFQTYKAENLAAQNSPAYWDLQKEPTQSQRELFKKYDSFSRQDYIRLSEKCQQNGIEFCSTPFDSKAVEDLDPLVSFFKIASADLTNLPLLRQVASKHKPVVLSTGASEMWEIALAVDELRKHECQQVVLLHCVLNYPTELVDANLNMIAGLKKAFPDNIIGYSDHTPPDEHMTTLATAFGLGARVIEKHYTYDKSCQVMTTITLWISTDLNKIRAGIKHMITVSGQTEVKRSIPTEAIARQHARRSIVLKETQKKGHSLTAGDITYKRPGSGISTIHWDTVIGKKIRRNLEG